MCKFYKKFLFSLLAIILPLSSGQAALYFSTEEDGIHSPVFILDSGDASDDFIDLEFGATIDAKLRYDVVDDSFFMNRELDISVSSGAALLNIETNDDVGAGNTAALFFTSDADGTPNPAGLGQFNDGALRFTAEGNLVVPDMIIVDDGHVGIGTDAPSDGSGAGGQDLHLDIEGAVGATEFCDENGENCYTTTELAAPPSTVDLPAALFTHSAVVDVNAAATDNLIPWDTETFIETNAYTHDTVTNNSRIAVSADGKYLVTGGISLSTTINTRYNGKVKIRLNGVTILPQRFQTGYMRDASLQDETTLVFSTILDLSAGDYFEILVDRENNDPDPANMNPNESSLSIVQLKSKGGDAAPFVSNAGIEIPPSTTSTFSITGTGFTPNSVVTFPGFPGTINSTTIVSPAQIDVDVTTTGVSGNYDVVITNDGIDNTFWTGNGVNLLSVQLVTGTGPAGTYTEGFEAGLGNYVDSGLDVAWTNNSGGTGSGGTGPTGASVGTFYMYTEASNPNFPGRTFGLETTNFNIAQSVSFDYHMFGAAMGDLEVQTLRSGVWTTRFTLSGQQQAAQGDAYLNQFVDLSTFQVEAIRFHYTSGANFTGDCSIDNVVIIST